MMIVSIVEPEVVNVLPVFPIVTSLYIMCSASNKKTCHNKQPNVRNVYNELPT